MKILLDEAFPEHRDRYSVTQLSILAHLLQYAAWLLVELMYTG